MKSLLLSLILCFPACVSAVGDDNNVAAHMAHDHECSICMDAVEHDHQRLACRHTFHGACIRRWAQQNNTCPICRVAINYVNAPADIRRAAPVNEIPGQEREEHALLRRLISTLEELESDEIDILLMDAFDNPLILIEHPEFMSLLDGAQKQLVHEIIDRALERDEIRAFAHENHAQAPAAPAPVAAPHAALSQQGQLYLRQLAASIAVAEDDEMDALLIEAFDNPLILFENPWFLQRLTVYQRALVNMIIEEYIA